MKKILILGGSHRDIPLIKAAQKLEYFVITLGVLESYLGHQYSDKFYLVDFNNLVAVEKIYYDENVDFLLPGCGEQSYLNTVKLSHKLNVGNFDTLEVAKLVHNKWKFKEFCLTNNISTPNGFYYGEIKKCLNFPLVVKPTDLSGGRGVEIVYNEIELENAIEITKQHSNEIFLEEFIDGELIAYSLIFRNQKISYAFCGADISYLNEYLITTAYPIKIKDIIEEKLKNNLEILAQKLNLVDGMFHAQLIIKNDIPYLIDVTRRIAGDLYPDLIERCNGIEYSKAVVESYTTGNITQNLLATQEQFIIRHVVMPSQNGTYKELFISEKIKKSIIYRFNLLNEGEDVEDFLHTQVTIVFIKGREFLKDLNSLIYPIIKSLI